MTDAIDIQETEIEVITADETTQEFELGEAPPGESGNGCALQRALGRADGRVVVTIGQTTTRRTQWTTWTTMERFRPKMPMCATMPTW